MLYARPFRCYIQLYRDFGDLTLEACPRDFWIGGPNDFVKLRSDATLVYYIRLAHVELLNLYIELTFKTVLIYYLHFTL